MVGVKKNWVYYMVKGIKNMFGKKIPSNWIEGMSMELKEKNKFKLYKPNLIECIMICVFLSVVWFGWGQFHLFCTC